MIKKIIKFLASLRFTVWLICLLGLIFMTGLWVPQKSLVKALYFDWKANAPRLVGFLDALGLTDIYTSPITVSLWVLFFLNLSLVMWQRIPLIIKRIELSPARIADPETAAGYSFHASYPLEPGMDADAVIGGLRTSGYVLLGDGSGFYGVKNRLSPIAFALFHLSFFLILLGGITGVYTLFIGYVDVAKGETFLGELDRYNKSPAPSLPKIGGIPKAAFMVESITPRVVRNTPTSISVMLVDEQGKKHEVGINTPYITDNTSFVFKHLGMAPLFVVIDPAGNEIDGAYEKLDVTQGRQDRFHLAGYDFAARFYPDYFLDNGKPATRSQEFNNPTFTIVVEREGKKIAEATVPKNGAMEFGGYRLVMRDLPFWVRFYVIKERGIAILYSGFAIATVAIIWRLLFFRREIIGAVREEDGVRHLVVAARSEYYKFLAEDEFTKMFDMLTNNGGKDR
jgi:cytochrome c biogenesis protein ResB